MVTLWLWGNGEHVKYLSAGVSEGKFVLTVLCEWMATNLWRPGYPRPYKNDRRYKVWGLRGEIWWMSQWQCNSEGLYDIERLSRRNHDTSGWMIVMYILPLLQLAGQSPSTTS